MPEIFSEPHPISPQAAVSLTDLLMPTGTKYAPKEALKLARRISEQSGIKDLLFDWKKKDRAGKTRPGRAPWINEYQVFILLLTVALTGQPTLITNVKELLLAFDNDCFEMLGVTPVRKLNEAEIRTEKRRRSTHRRERAQGKLLDPQRILPPHIETMYDRIYHSYRLLTSLVDPHQISLYRRYTLAEWEIVKQKLPANDKEHFDRTERAHILAGRILHGTFYCLPRKVRRRIAKNTPILAVDGTFLPVKEAHLTGKKLYAPAEATAAYHVRSGNHFGGDFDDYSKAQQKTSQSEKVGFGYELHLAVLSSDDAPRIALGMTQDKPGFRSGENGFYAAQMAVKNNNLESGIIGSDREYPYSKLEKYLSPVRAMGFEPIFDYRKDDLGLQGSHKGFILVEGSWYSPSMPQKLIEATFDYRERRKSDPQRIDEQTYRERIAMREPYRAAIKEHPNEQGVWRAQCPAVGGSAQVICSLREPHVKTEGRHLMPVFPQITMSTGEVPTCCEQKTVTFPGLLHPKLEQKYVFESEEWSRIYRSLRGAVESFNSSAKRGYGAAKLGDSTMRPRRGWIAHFLAALVGVASVNVAKISHWWINHGSRVAHDGTLTVKPKKGPLRRRERTAGFTRGDDPPDKAKGGKVS